MCNPSHGLSRKTRAQSPARARHSPSIIEQIRASTSAPAFGRFVKSLLIELCQIDTTPKPEIALMRAAEEKCFRVIERELPKLGFPGALIGRRPINPAIERNPNYSLLHFTKTARRPEGLSPQEVYAGRNNLIFQIPGSAHRQAGLSIALNAHIDVVAPYFPPRSKGSVVYGRGACDDKGPVVGIIAALKVLAKVMPQSGLNRNLLAMFVVEEETGGNGSLSLALDSQLKKLYDSVVVCECTGLRVHPANRGAVWYRAELQPLAGVSTFEMFAFVNEEMEKEGAAIRAESRHALFPQRPVQTCHGMVGPFGEHPSRICGEVSFRIEFGQPPEAEIAALVGDCLDAGLANYIGLYGDKTKVLDPATREPMVARHYDIQTTSRGFRVMVHGAAGHMGSIRERDGAVTKMAHLVRSLVYSRPRLECLAGASLHLALDISGASKANSGVERTQAGRAPGGLVLEGGQGFVPTHSMEEVMTRMRQAAQRGAETYLRRLGRSERGEDAVEVVYEKLHNAAFDGDPNSPSMRTALSAARACRLPASEPVLGWTVSCDARLFATQYPSLPVLTFGPGQLVHAHSDHEQIALDEIRTAAEFLALFVLHQTGTFSNEPSR